MKDFEKYFHFRVTKVLFLKSFFTSCILCIWSKPRDYISLPMHTHTWQKKPSCMTRWRSFFRSSFVSLSSLRFWCWRRPIPFAAASPTSFSSSLWQSTLCSPLWGRIHTKHTFGYTLAILYLFFGGLMKGIQTAESSPHKCRHLAPFKEGKFWVVGH